MTIVVTGAEGMLGSAVVRVAQREGLEVLALSRQDCDITDFPQVRKALPPYSFTTVINCAGIVRERQDLDGDQMQAVNIQGPHMLAQNAGRVLQVSTDCVFDGAILEGGYSEEDEPNPPDRYGQTKWKGELCYGPNLTVRASFVGLGQRGLLHWLLAHPEGAEVAGYTNWWWNGWTARALAPRLLELALNSAFTGMVHWPGPEVVTKAWLLREVAARLRPDLTVVETEAPEPSRMVLTTTKEVTWMTVANPTWDAMLDELEREYRTS